MNHEAKALWSKIEKWKYPILILLAGLLLMLAPGAEKEQTLPPDTQEALAAILSHTQGVGQARVLISGHGVVVACTGAANASVRLDIIRAVSSYTGFGSDKITILKLKN
jgi:hypothetical protein